MEGEGRGANRIGQLLREVRLPWEETGAVPGGEDEDRGVRMCTRVVVCACMCVCLCVCVCVCVYVEDRKNLKLLK